MSAKGFTSNSSMPVEARIGAARRKAAARTTSASTPMSGRVPLRSPERMAWSALRDSSRSMSAVPAVAVDNRTVATPGLGTVHLEAGAAQWPTALFGGYDVARYVHFICMSAIVAFLVVHVALAVLVPKSLRAMIIGR